MTKNLAITCISRELRKELEGELSAKDKKLLAQVPACDSKTALEFQQVSERAKRVKRGPSAYQRYISECMRAGSIKGPGEAAERMKKCASGWRRYKGQ